MNLKSTRAVAALMLGALIVAFVVLLVLPAAPVRTDQPPTAGLQVGSAGSTAPQVPVRAPSLAPEPSSAPKASAAYAAGAALPPGTSAPSSPDAAPPTAGGNNPVRLPTADHRGIGSGTFAIHDGGVMRQFELALDELWVIDEDGKGRAVTISAASPEELEQQVLALVASGQAAEPILYEAGVGRDEFTRRTLSSRVTAELGSRFEPAEFARRAGALSFEVPEYAPGHVVLRAGPGLAALRLAERLASEPGVKMAEAQLARQQSKRAMPNDTLINQQWHLKFNNQAGALAGTDLNIESVWAYPTNGAGFRGRGVRIGIVDDGLQTAHPDFAGNIDTVNDFDWNGNDNDPNPGTGDDHGTACGGDAAARGNNGLGVSGSAPEGTLVGMRLIAAATTDSQEAAAMNHLPQLIEIKSNSWGPSDTGRVLEAPGTLTRAALQNAAENGRGGRGTIFTWAGGNGLQSSDNSNYDGYANSIYTIAIAAFDSRSRQAYYSEPGANIVVTSPSSGSSPALGKTTTDRTGTAGYNTASSGAGGDYTDDFGGTSSATPTASGVVALMLEANPNLGWRDVQEILMRSAKKVNPADSDWKTPIGPDNINHNHKFGAGLIDATAAVNLAASWTNLGSQTSAVLTQSGLSVPIPDNNAAGITRTFDFSASNLRVEHVTVKLSVSTVRKGQLEVTLTSPSGTVSRLAERHSDTTNLYSGWTFMTVRNWGESSPGVWTLRIADRTSGTTGTLTAAEVTIFGTNAAPINPAPTVAVTQPVSGSFVASGGSVLLTATASDLNINGQPGVVSSVQFFQGATLIGTGSFSGGVYSYNWVSPPAGTYTITARATDSEGAVGVSPPVVFTVLSGSGAPVISSINPSSAPVASSVVLTGSNFVEVSAVQFNGLAAASFSVDSATQITAVVPVGATSGPITVANSFGSGNSPSPFTVTELPVLISQIYGAGGNTGATYNADYVELYNRSGSPVNLVGWSVQYASSTGITWSVGALSGTIAPGKYFLVKLAGGSAGAALPAADATPSTSINMSGTSGKVALRNTSVFFTGSSPIGQEGLQDFVGYGSATAFEGSGSAPSPSTTTAIFRAGNGATDTGDNSSDFTASTPNPRNSAFGGGSAPVITSPLTASGTVGQLFSYQITASNAPTSFGAVGLPSGLSVNTNSGLISGTPGIAGTNNVTISAANGSGSDSKTLVLTVNPSGGGGSATVFSENMGTPGGTTTISNYVLGTAPATFQNKGVLTFGQGEQANPADVRITQPSAGYTGASGNGNVWFTTTSGAYGFSIEAINASGFTGLAVSYGYYKNVATNHAAFSVDYWNGSAWVNLANTAADLFNESPTAATGWYLAKSLALPAAAQINGLKIRFVKTGTLGIRIDDVKLTGTAASSPVITASGTLSNVTTIYGSPSPTPTSFTLSGTNMTEGILVTPPPGFEVSQTAGGASGYAATQTVGAAGTISNTAVFVRLAAGTTAGQYSGDVVCSSAGASSVNVAVPPSNVNLKSLTITANDQAKTFGQSLTLGAGQTAFSSVGLVLGQTIGTVTLTASGGTGANDASGTYEITPSDATGGTFSPANYDIGYEPGTLAVLGQTYGAWSSGLSDPSPGADLDLDGLPNLAEYYMALDANTPDSGTSFSYAGGVLTMDYRRNKNTQAVMGAVKWHPNLVNPVPWATNGVVDQFLSDHGGYEMRRATVPVAPEEGRKFLRLEVTEP